MKEKKKKTKEEPVEGFRQRVTWSGSILKGELTKKRNQTGGSTHRINWSWERVGVGGLEIGRHGSAIVVVK